MSNWRNSKVVTVLEILMARLRFVAVFVIAALLVGYWDDIKNHVDKWTRPTVAPDSLAQAAVSDIEFYCPMHPQVIRREPGPCPICQMPLVKRKRGELVKLPVDVLARVQISPQRIALANVQTTAVTLQRLSREISAIGVLDYDETRLARLSARIAGRVDDLFVSFTGQAVKKGEAVYSLYSPDAYTAQREYLLARKRVNQLPTTAPEDIRSDAAAIYNASLQKLVLWGINQAELDKLDEEFDRHGQVPTDLTITSPISGIVVKKEINPGQYVQTGDSPYTVADLSSLWLQVKLYERDIPLIRIGDMMQVTVNAFPNETFPGTVTFKAFQLDPQTRTLDARVVVANPNMKLRPGMFATARIGVPITSALLSEDLGAMTRAATAQPMPGTTHDSSSNSSIPSPLPAVNFADAFALALRPYLQAQLKLSQDSLQDVQQNLAETVRLAEPLEKSPTMQDAFQRLQASVVRTAGQSIGDVRNTFKDISIAMIDLGKAATLAPDAPAVKVFRCPMKKAVWLQEGSDTLNPYYGSEMLTCGSAVDTLPATPHTPLPTSRPATSKNQMLAVPRSAVIDTGRNQIVYVESSPGVYDMTAIKIGPAAGEFYPVLSGLAEGDRVVTVGTFLVDSENRLNPQVH